MIAYAAALPFAPTVAFAALSVAGGIDMCWSACRHAKRYVDEQLIPILTPRELAMSVE
jgi:hypothetical protein